MAVEKRYTQATWKIMEQLLEVDRLEDALPGSLEIIYNTLNSEAGAIWLLDKSTDRLSPLFHIGPADVSNITVENGQGIEGVVTKTGRSIMVQDAPNDPRFDGTAFDENGLTAKTMLCVPLNNLHEVIGCVQLVNKKDGGAYEEEDLQLCEHMASLAAMTIEEKGLLVDLSEKKEVLAVLRDVTKEFPSGGGVLKVLKGINLEIYKNEFVIILGESGCGKTTMMNIVGGMDFLTSGELTIEGKDFSHPSDDELTKYRRDYIGYIFQFFNLLPDLNVRDNIRVAEKLTDKPMEYGMLLDQLGLAGIERKYPNQLSGGQQQRVAIARALVKNPRLLLCDEPTGALDSATAKDTLILLEKINAAFGTTILMVTHNQVIPQMMRQNFAMKDGRIIENRVNEHPVPASALEGL